jgi:hypothetical protein
VGTTSTTAKKISNATPITDVNSKPIDHLSALLRHVALPADAMM